MSATDIEEADTDLAARIEAGRLLFARPWQFVLGVPQAEALPPPEGIEIAFAGRSNVGKSSLINALTGQKGLARTSRTPGRTRELNLFVGEPGLTIVDMPGYGYAEAGRAAVEAWTRTVFAYLRGRANLRRVFLLIDARHGLKPNDIEVMQLLDRAAVSYQIVLTKADKTKPAELAATAKLVAAGIARHPAAYPEIIVTSTESGAGIEALRAEIAGLRP